MRPAPTGARYAIADRARPSYCTLSMLFSDWDRSGRRDLRVSNDRHYYRDGEEQLWRIEPGGRRASTPTPMAGGRSGSGAWASQARTSTGDGYPEVYLTSQGDNKLQTLEDGPATPTYEDIALARGVTRAPAVRRRRRRSPRPPGTRSSRTSTTTASSTCS